MRFESRAYLPRFLQFQSPPEPSMPATVADFLLDRLHQWGVQRIYGHPGEGVSGIVEALGRSLDKIEFVQAGHEELGAFMACAHAKFSGEVGVCLATSGPGRPSADRPLRCQA
jgi:thiamine pyrophosphate-dependent acetolactate synthase large subunit-like protein